MDEKRSEMDAYNESIEIEIIGVLDRIRPFIQGDGGDIRFVGYDNGTVYIKFFGACVGCMSIDDTLESGIAAILKEEIPEVENVVNIDSLENPESEENNEEVKND